MMIKRATALAALLATGSLSAQAEGIHERRLGQTGL